MVFESTISSILNKFLGDFVENLDGNQLSLGIWGGDVELRDLVIKPSALDELDLPIQTAYGSIGKLVLKIPWKSLYTSPWIVELDSIFLLAVPNQQVTYDPIKELKIKSDEKKKEIQKLEDKKKAEESKDKPKADPTFVEKLITTIIKNLQLRVTNIHIRYEDRVTNPDSPFAFGVSLHSLLCESTDADFKKTICEDMVKIYKVVSLEALAIYCNTNTELYGDLGVEAMKERLRGSISTKRIPIHDFKYVLGPINASARIRMNERPEDDKPQYSIPKMQINLDMEQLFIGLSRSQYRDIIALVDSLDRMTRGVRYRKFRPNDGYKGHYKEWWHFAYNSILDDIRRRRREWDWGHMKEYREMCAQYSLLYKKCLGKKGPSKEDKFKLEEYERDLDISSIVIMRQQAEFEAEREAAIEAKRDTGWMGWLTGRGSTTSIQQEVPLIKQFQSEMTPEEKEKFYKAIGFEEGDVPTAYPVSFVANSLTFLLRNLKMELLDDEDEVLTVISVDMSDVGVKVEHRPGANAIKLDVKVSSLLSHGFRVVEDFTPKLISAIDNTNEDLLAITFETNPENEMCDQSIHVVVNPLVIIHDAATTNKAIDIFKIPPDTTVHALEEVAGTGLKNVRAMTATGLQYAIEKHVRLEVFVDVQAPQIIIPYGGRYTGNESVLVVNLGRLKIYSDNRRAQRATVQVLFEQGLAQEDIYSHMREHSYDHITLDLTDLQVVIAQGDENWKQVIHESKFSDMHLLSPLSLRATYSKCLISDDPNLPLNKLRGKLAKVDIRLTESRIMLLVALGTSIPLPSSDIPEPQPLTARRQTSSMALDTYKGLQERAKRTRELLPKQSADSLETDFVQFTTLEAHFILSGISITMNKQATLGDQIVELATFNFGNLECDMYQKTYVFDVQLVLSSISFDHNNAGQHVSLINTPHVDKEDEYLFKVEFIQVDPKSPELHSKYGSSESTLNLDFGILNILLHQECLLTLMAFSTSMQEQVNELLGDTQVSDRYVSIDSKGLSAISENVGDLDKYVKKTKKSTELVVENIKFKVSAMLQELKIKFATAKKELSECSITGIVADVIMKKTYTQVNANIQDIQIIDLNPKTLHKLILSHYEGTALKAQVVMNNVENPGVPNMEITVKMCGAKIVFLNLFVSRMLHFMEKFQEPQKMLLEASQAAAQQAKENVKNIYATETKIALDIDIKAPDIIVPVHSRSYSALMLDLGTLSLTNTFLTLDKKNEQGVSVIIDELRIDLAHFELSRVKLDEKMSRLRDVQLIEPVSVDLLVRRNLSASWFKDIPDIHVTGKIGIINVILTQGDYIMVMKTLNENFAEGQKASRDAKVKVELKAPAVLAATEELIHVEYGPVCRTTITKKEAVNVSLKFAFRMDALLLNLYTGAEVWDLKKSPALGEKAHLALFSIEGFSVKGRILSDSSIVMSALLVNCYMDDMRAGREGKLNRFIQRSHVNQEDLDSTLSSTESVAAPRSMIDITYHQQPGGDIFTDVRIYSFTMILAVDYLVKLSGFFNTNSNVDITIDTSRQPTDPTPNVSTELSQLTVSQGEQPEKPPPQMTINLKVEKPDIILVEHMDNINTNALILSAEIIVKLRLAGKHQVINGNMQRLQLYMCNYNPDYREETKSHVLHPVDISIAGSTPQDKGLHIELFITDVKVSISPTTVELLNRVQVTMNASSGEKIETAVEQFNHTELWNPKEFEDREYWFLKTDPAQDAGEIYSIDSMVAKLKTPLNELCIITVPSIVFTVEAGVGSETLPMILLETGFKGSARNWSSQLGFEATLTLQMGYYNSTLALWEPLIEPVEVIKNDRPVYIPWELRVEVSMNEQEEAAVANSPTTSGSDTEPPPPVMSIDVISDHTLEMTVSKTCLDVFQNLGKAFSKAIETSKVATAAAIATAPYKVVNAIGEDVTLMLEESSFKIAEGGSLDDLNTATGVPLQLKADIANESKLQLMAEFLKDTQKVEKFLNVKVNSTNSEIELPIGRADKRFFMLNHRGEGNDSWGVISDIKVDSGITIITIRSVLKVHNHFCQPIEVYYMTARDNELELIDMVEPNGSLNVPLKAVYTPTKELFFGVLGHSVSSMPFVWKDLETNLSVTRVLQCPHKERNVGKGPFVMKCIGLMKQVYFEQTMRHTMASTCYYIHLRPAVIFQNFLPYDVVCCVDEQADEYEVKAGDTLQLPNVNPGKNILVIRIADYLEKEWSCRREIENDPQEFNVWTFHSYDSPAKMSLDLGMQSQNKEGSLVMSLYCPLWMLNKTGLMIGYRESDENLNVMHHPPHFKGPILFSFNVKNFFGKKKASIRVEYGPWSDKFSLDVAGSSGVVTCKTNDKTYQIGVHNQLTYNNLTKQITFTPYYVIINNAPYTIMCQEHDRPADPWISIEPKSCNALWPVSTLDDKLLRLRVTGTEDITAPFLYTESHNTLLRLNNKYGGINVDIQLTEGGVYINMVPYEPGCAPALMINYTETHVTFWEKESVQKRILEPHHSVLYAWENPSGPRMIVWDKGNNKEVVEDLRKDACGEYSPKNGKTIFWASFLDGMQRVLLFTEVKAIAESAEASTLYEVIQQEINVAIHGIGLSLVNNPLRLEVMYLGIASSEVIWQFCKEGSKRFKNFSTKQSVLMENSYQYYLEKQILGDAVDHTVNIDGKTVVDFRENLIVKPNRKKIRRKFQTGLWAQMKTSPSQMQLHAKINRLQIDNQSYDCIFPVVLAPVPTPKSMALDSGSKPFVEVSIVQLLLKNSQVKQFKYFKVLIQEFDIKVDLGFVNALLELVQPDELSDEEVKELFLKDKNLVEESLYLHASGESLKEQKSFYDLLHFSPLKIHVSFSMAASSSSPGQNAKAPNFLNILLQGIGVTLTEIQDVIFRLAYFERTFTFLTQRQLIDEVTKHYIGQSIKQLYVLVLGLDVLGNPFGLVLGITKGVEDLFYEPIQGAIQGPGEFAQGLALGVKSLFGHTVGGAAGAVSRITGAMGKGIAVLTFDEDYQRKRRDQLNKKPANAAEGMARSGKGLVMGVVSGVTGVITKPVSGAREQGVEGFFKGLGKGAVGLVTRPVAGVVDFASGSLDVVRRATEGGEEVTRLRSPRFLPSDGLVRPYNKKEAQGHKLLVELSKGKYAATDIYTNHFVIIENKELLLLTDKRIAYIIHNDIFGGWQIDWAYTWNELPQPAKVVPKGVQIVAHEKKKKLFGSGETTKTLLVGDPDVKEEICLSIESLRGS